jgi:surface protein
MNGMFREASAFNQAISSWTGTAAATAQSNMFVGATAFQARFTCTDAVTGPVNSCACTKCIPNASWHAFIEACLSEKGAKVTGECTTWASGNNYGTMRNWDVSLVEDMSGYDYPDYKGFGNSTAFNGDIESWNTAQVTNMKSMFRFATAFNQDIGNWNTEKVTNMNSMFSSASAFNHDIGSWNTEKVTDMRYMFKYASAFNHNISSWTGPAATTAQSDMFSGANAFRAKYTCGFSGPASSCDTVHSTWVAPSSSTATLTGLVGLISASVVAFVLV